MIDFIKLDNGTAKNIPHIPNMAPKKKTESNTTTAGNLTTPDIKNGKNIFPSMNCSTTKAKKITRT